MTEKDLEARIQEHMQIARENLKEFRRTGDRSHVKRLCVATDVYDYIFRNSEPAANPLPGMPRLGLVELDIDEHDRVSSMGVEEDILMDEGAMEFRDPMQDMNSMLLSALFSNRHARGR